MEDVLANPVLNRPYDPAVEVLRAWPKGSDGKSAGGQAPSGSFIPVPQVKKRGRRAQPNLQEALDFDATHERVEKNTLINDLRRAVETLAGQHYQGVTLGHRKLLRHWADPHRENRVMYCQREAAETAIFLAEVAGRQAARPTGAYLLDDANDEHNAGLPGSHSRWPPARARRSSWRC